MILTLSTITLVPGTEELEAKVFAVISYYYLVGAHI